MSSAGSRGASASGAAGPPAIARWITPKVLVSFLITLILVVGQMRYQILGGYEWLALALGSCIAIEFALSLLVRGRRPPSVLSAYISGNSLAILLKPAAGLLWPFGLGAALAIGSKYTLTFRRRHLWNPTNFAIAALVLLAPGSVSILSHEMGNDLRVNLVIWGIGLVTVWRARLLHVTLSYAGAFIAFAALRAVLVDVPVLVELAPLTGPMYQLFVFFMITDPPTTVRSLRGRVLVAILIAAAETVLRLGNDFELSWAAPFAPAPAIFALAIVGPLAKAVDLARAPAPGA